ncbi:MAG: sugar phosphate isomerase/epimerase [Clostridiales bacterium]|jgi:sugar phosphate isomerase/epimerase|nr:sugar phosphate isomerase/epimerase [Clostridiales bacterium]
MKLAFSTLGSPDWSFDKTLEVAHRLGFEAIEIRGMEGKMHADEITRFFPENEAETKRKLKEYNLKICVFGTSVIFHDAEKYDSMIQEGKTAIDVCSRMEIPYIRVFGDKIPSAEIKDQVIANVIRGIRELCSYARGKNVKVLQEVHGDFNTVENITAVIEGVKDCPEFGLVWDIAHSDREYGDDYMEFYSWIKPYILHTHIKDHKRNNGKFDLCPVGEGDIPIRDIIKTLKADGYTGYFSFEWEKKWHPELMDAEIVYPRYVEYMKSLDL